MTKDTGIELNKEADSLMLDAYLREEEKKNKKKNTKQQLFTKIVEKQIMLHLI